MMDILRDNNFFHHLEKIIPQGQDECIRVTIEPKSKHMAMMVVDTSVKNSAKVQSKSYLVTSK